MELTDQQILDRIKSVCADALKVKHEAITPEARFKEELGADSLDTIVLLMNLEEEFKSRISDEEARTLACVGDVIALVKNKSPVLS